MKELTITIFENSDGEFQYDIYDTTDLTMIDEGNWPPEDGGTCTTTLLNALEMATSQAKKIK